MPERPTEHIEEAVRLQRGGLLEKALQHLEAGVSSSADPEVLAEALRHQADIHRARCDWDRAIELARRSAEVAVGAGLADLRAEALNAEAAVHMSRGDFDRAIPLLRRMLEVTDDPRICGIALQNLGTIAGERERFDEAQRHFAASYRRFEQADYRRGMAFALGNSGHIALLAGRLGEAEDLCGRAVDIARRIGDLELVAGASLSFAAALLRSGRIDEAEPPATEALGYFTAIGNHWRRIECFRVLGELHEAAGDPDSARHCYVRALALAHQFDAPLEASRMEAALAALAARTTPPPTA